jgi:hypothetical protein
MDEIVDKLARLESDDNAGQLWKEITEQISVMEQHQVPLLWGAMLMKLASDPPPIPVGDISQAQWLDMCKARYHVLYQCALHDAGRDEQINFSLNCDGKSKDVVGAPSNATDSMRQVSEAVKEIQALSAAGGQVEAAVAASAVKIEAAVAAKIDKAVAASADNIEAAVAAKIDMAVAALADNIEAAVAASADKIEAAVAAKIDMAVAASTAKTEAAVAASADKLKAAVAAKLEEYAKDAAANAALIARREAQIVIDYLETTFVQRLEASIEASAEKLETSIEASKFVKPTVVQPMSAPVQAIPMPAAPPLTSVFKFNAAIVAAKTALLTTNNPDRTTWTGILPVSDEQSKDKIHAMLLHAVKYLKIKQSFVQLYEKYTNAMHARIPEEDIGKLWFWVERSGMHYVHNDVIKQLTDLNYIAPANVNGNDPDLPKISAMLQTILTMSTQIIPSSVLSMLLNKYSSENSLKDNPTARVKFTFHKFPLLFSDNGIDMDFSSGFIFNSMLTTHFFFVDSKGLLLHEKLSWDPDEWFENELAEPASWFDSIASTLSASARERPGPP